MAMEHYVIAFVDIVGYSRLVGAKQLEAVEALGRAAKSTVFGAHFSNRSFGVMLPTGDGLLVACTKAADNPQHVLEFLVELRNKLRPTYELRCGLHIGPGQPFRDVNAKHYADPELSNNVASVAVNEAQRIMSLADPGQTLASKEFVHAIETQSSDPRLLAEFHQLGVVRVKHGLRLELFAHARHEEPKPPKRVLDYMELQSSIVRGLQSINNAIVAKFSKGGNKLEPRVTLLLHDPSEDNLYVTQLRVGYAVSAADHPSTVRFRLDEGPGIAFAKARSGERSPVPYIELPPPPPAPLSVTMPYVVDFAKQSGIHPTKIVNFKRPSRAYLYLPVTTGKRGGPFGVVSIDTMWPIFDLGRELSARERKARGDAGAPPAWLIQKIEKFNQSIAHDLNVIADAWHRINTF
jgi:class 3 adenylate cyclase